MIPVRVRVPVINGPISTPVAPPSLHGVDMIRAPHRVTTAAGLAAGDAERKRGFSDAFTLFGRPVVRRL